MENFLPNLAKDFATEHTISVEFMERDGKIARQTSPPNRRVAAVCSDTVESRSVISPDPGAKDLWSNQTQPPCEIGKKISSLHGCQNDSKQRD